MTELSPLMTALTATFAWHGARITFVSQFLIALIRVRTVNFTEIATAFCGAVKPESHYRRIQRFKITRFYGTSENAVKTQVWIAICAYILVAIVKKRLQLDISLYNMLQILSVNPFEKIPLYQLFSQSGYENNIGDIHNQLSLFDL